MRQKPVVNPDGSVTIFLNHGYETVISAEDSDLTEFTWRADVQERFGLTYAWRAINLGITLKSQKHLYLHRIIMSRVLNREILKNELVDHKDLNGLNNRRDNLRLASVNQNTQNQKKRANCTSKYKGVTWNKACSKWQSQIKHQGKNIYLGIFDDPADAHEAYKAKAKELFGEFARCE